MNPDSIPIRFPILDQRVNSNMNPDNYQMIEQQPDVTDKLHSKSIPLQTIILSLFILLLSSSTAYLGYQNMQLQKQIMEFQKPISYPTPTLTPTRYPMDNWKTYTNTKYNFLVKYPGNFMVGFADVPSGHFNSATGNESQIDFLPTMNDEFNNFIQIQVADSKTIGKSLEQAIQESYQANKSHFQASSVSNLQNVIFAGENDYEYFFTGRALQTLTWESEVSIGSYKVVMFEKDGQIYSFYLKNTALFNQILSTFTFTDQAAITPTCVPRPACLDSSPRCMIPETSDMCPPKNTTCNSDRDCTNGATCMVAGPLIAGQTPNKVCVEKGQVVPL